MNTEAVTIARSNPPLVLQGDSQRASYLSVIHELGELLSRYANNSDSLSKRLLEEGEEFKRYALASQANPPLENLILRLEALRACLINPCTKAGFIEPWLVEDKVWEKSHLEFLCSLNKAAIPGAPHAFAKEFIVWLNALPDAESARKIAAKLRLLEEQEAKIIQQSAVINALKEANQWLVQEIEERDAEKDQKLERLDRQVEAFAQEARAGIETVRREYQASQKMADERLENAEKYLEASKEELSHAKQEITDLKSSAARLMNHNLQLESKVDHLQREAANSGKCTIL